MRWPRLSLPIHLSPYPSQLGGRVVALVSSFVLLLKTGMGIPVLITRGLISLCIYIWWAEFLEEIECGEGTLQVYDNLKLSFCLFIRREIMFFLTLFWTFFHYSLSPSIFTGHSWPGRGISLINPKGVPLLNTFLLVRRGVTVTWGHHLLLTGEKKTSYWVFIYTIFLGRWLLFNQVLEFKESSFSLGDRVCGRIFLVLTGFHGLHVLLGLLILFEGVDGVRIWRCSSLSHTKLELFIWYWHLVDCIWLVVYSLIYWWGG